MAEHFHLPTQTEIADDGAESADEELSKLANLDSADPEARKAARRNRRARRTEAKKPQTERKAEEMSPIQIQLEHSHVRIEGLLRDGDEYITNIQVANDRREINRRQLNEEEREKRMVQLKEEATLCSQKFEEITSRWVPMSKICNPLDLNKEIDEQRVKCLDLLDQKNNLISGLQDELDLAFDRYEWDQNSQKEDLRILTDRIDQQVVLMRRAYREELQGLEMVLDPLREENLLKKKLLCDELAENFKNIDNENAKVQHNRIIQKSFEVDKIYEEHFETFRKIRISLENDLEKVRRQFEGVKFQCLINSEKLRYNYQVLKKREDENLLIRSIYSKKLTKLKDEIRKLLKFIKDIDDMKDKDSLRLNQEISLVHTRIKKLEEKTDQFTINDDNRYRRLWQLNESRVKKLLNSIHQADREIFRQVLGLPWMKPDQTIKLLSNFPSYQEGVAEVEKVFRPTTPPLVVPPLKDQPGVDKSLLKAIFFRLAGATGFLLEERLDTLLDPYLEDEKTLIKMDNVCRALGVTNDADIVLLAGFLHPYAQCHDCLELDEVQRTRVNIAEPDGSKLTIEVNVDEIYEEAEQDPACIIETHYAKKNCSGENRPHHILLTTSAEYFKVQEKTNHFLEKIDRKLEACENGHDYVLNPNLVMHGLRDFLLFYMKKKEETYQNMEQRLSRVRPSISRSLSKKDVTEFWGQFVEQFRNEELWDLLYTAQTRYHQMLVSRSELIEKNNFLRKQNEELLRILGRYNPPSDEPSGPPIVN